MKEWLLFVLGTIGYFVYKYINRSEKVSDFTFSFWIKDNWPEFLLAQIFDIAAMIIVMDNGTTFDLSSLLEFLPVGVVVPAKLVVSFFIGYGGGYAVYNMLKKKTQYEIEKKG